MVDPTQGEVKTVEARTVMAVVKPGAVSEVGRRLEIVMRFLGRAGARPAGPAVSIWYDEEFNPQHTNFAAGWPVAEPLPPGRLDGEEVTAVSLPAGKVVSITHVGPYDDLPGIYDRLMAFIKREGLRVTGPPREIYLSDPQATPGPTTEVQFPVA